MVKVVVVAVVCAIVATAPSPGLAGAPKCRASDPAAAGDADAVSNVRDQIDATCPCESFPADGKKSMHGQYVTCAKGVVKAAVDAEQLRAQCKKLALYPAAFSTCGYPAEPPRMPCLKTSKKGPACKIKTCQGSKDLPCPAHDNCLAAADTNHDGQVTGLDSGQCNPRHDCAAVTSLSQSYVDNAVVACFNGCDDPLTIQDCVVGCAAGGATPMIERRDALLAVCEADPTLSCDELHAAFLQTCANLPAVPQGCLAQCGEPVCESRCALVSNCAGVAANAHANCLSASN